MAELAQIKICETLTRSRSFKGIIYIIQVKQQQSPKHSKLLLLQGKKETKVGKHKSYFGKSSGVRPFDAGLFIKIDRMIIRGYHHLHGPLYSILFSKQDAVIN